MATRFYKKLVPKNCPVLSNGTKIQFSTNDGVQGFFSTDSEMVQSEFARFQAEQKFGIEEITEAQYVEDYVQKKTPSGNSEQHWREEWGQGSSKSVRQVTSILPGNALDRAVAVNGINDANTNRGERGMMPNVARVPNATQQTVPSQKKEEFTPATGKRPVRE